MKKQLNTLIVLVAVPLFSLAQTADEIIDKHVAALGGADKIAAVKTMEQGFTRSGMGREETFKLVYVVGKSMRSEMSTQDLRVVEVVDGDKRWVINFMNGTQMPAHVLPAHVARKAETFPQNVQLFRLKGQQYPYELTGREKQNSKDVYLIRATLPEGVVSYYIDANTYRLSGYRVQSKQVDLSWTFTDYNSVDGLLFPYTSQVTDSRVPGSTSTHKLTYVKINPTVDPVLFTVPK